eukprot:416316-Rhodomonas_salina.1
MRQQVQACPRWQCNARQEAQVLVNSTERLVVMGARSSVTRWFRAADAGKTTAPGARLSPEDGTRCHSGALHPASTQHEPSSAQHLLTLTAPKQGSCVSAAVAPHVIACPDMALFSRRAVDSAYVDVLTSAGVCCGYALATLRADTSPMAASNW